MIGAKVINEKKNTPHGVRVAFGRCSRKVLEGWGFNEKMGLLQIFEAFFFAEKEIPLKREKINEVNKERSFLNVITSSPF